MKKIISLFARNYNGDRLVRDEVVPGAEWVLAGEGQATRKYDGTCCLIENGRLFKRYTLKLGKPAPFGFVPATDRDPVTMKQEGWVPVGDGPDDEWHIQAFGRLSLAQGAARDGTYELVGPKVQGNPEREPTHVLVPHGATVLEDVPRDFDGIRDYLATHDIEGIVWHHEDGRMVKIKKRDFGLKRGVDG